METSFIEMIVVLAPGGDRKTVESWFTQRGFEVLPMRAGVLVTGSGKALTTALGVTLEATDRKTVVSVPVEIAQHVVTMTVHPPPDYQA